MRIAIAVIALGLAPVAHAAAEGELAVGSGVHFTSGTYGGSTRTNILSIPFTARYENGPWVFRAAVPYLRISGESTVVPGAGRVDSGNTIDTLLGGPPRRSRPGETTSASGMGDATFSATYAVLSATARSGLGLNGKAKLPSGDEKQGLGTGSTDLSAQIEAFQHVERNTVFGAIGYTMFGDSPLARFENVANFGLGVSHRTDGGTVGLAFDARQGGSPAPAPQRELTAFLTHRLDRNWRAQLYALKGFASGSPDWGAGISAAYAF